MSWAVLTVGGCAWLVWCERSDSRFRWLAKPLASVGFVAVGLSRDPSTAYDGWIVAGLVLGVIGDVALLGHGTRPFLVGLSAFLLGHLAYVFGFLTAGPSVPLAAAAAVVLTAVGVVIWRWLQSHLPGPLRGPVAAYVTVILAMTALGVGMLTQRWPATAGAVLFTASDLAVARNEFVSESFVNRAWGLPAYYAGQLLIAVSIGG